MFYFVIVYKIIIIILLLTSGSLWSQPVVINEFMASNSSVIADEDGDYPDWIELYNTGDEPVNMGGYTLSDKEDKLFMWSFPDVEIGSRSFLLLFVSDKNRKGSFLHTNFKISADGETLTLCNNNGQIVDRVDAIKLETDQSYGRLDDGGEEWSILLVPMPGKTNNNQYGMKQISFSRASLSVSGRFYTQSCSTVQFRCRKSDEFSCYYFYYWRILRKLIHGEMPVVACSNLSKNVLCIS
ncbi:MAG: lamin tail domain-containing protein [Salinivirgaceae bacterium]|jgi:hypothetical protein|nr:lamin tail domain-containing protein [Salinivirgaceae bacterium]